MSETILELHGIYKSFDGTPVLKGIGLQVERGEFITLLGASSPGWRPPTRAGSCWRGRT